MDQFLKQAAKVVFAKAAKSFFQRQPLFSGGWPLCSAIYLYYPYLHTTYAHVADRRFGRYFSLTMSAVGAKGYLALVRRNALSAFARNKANIWNPTSWTNF